MKFRCPLSDFWVFLVLGNVVFNGLQFFNVISCGLRTRACRVTHQHAAGGSTRTHMHACRINPSASMVPTGSALAHPMPTLRADIPWVKLSAARGPHWRVSPNPTDALPREARGAHDLRIRNVLSGLGGKDSVWELGVKNNSSLVLDDWKAPIPAPAGVSEASVASASCVISVG